MATFRNPFDRRQQVDPEDERDFWSGLASTASPLLSGLSSVGFGIEKYGGGRALKGLLAGKPRELLSIIPGSDQMQLTQASDRTGGAELLHRWGLTSQRDPSLFSGEGAAGLAADIVFDPLNALFLGGGAVTNLGKAIGKAGVSLKGGAARAAGLAQGSDELAKAAKYLSSTPEAASGVRGFFGMPESQVAANIAGKKLGGNIGFGLPFGLSDRATAVIPWAGIGNAATKVPLAGPVLGGIGKGLQGMGRIGSAAFEKAVKGKIDPIAQTIARAQSAAEPQAVAEGSRVVQDLMEQVPGANWMDPKVGEQVRNIVEDPRGAGLAAYAAGDPLQQSAAFHQQAAKAERAMTRQYRKAPVMVDPFRGTQYATRQASSEYTDSLSKTAGTTSGLEKARVEPFSIGLTTDQHRKFFNEPIAGRTVDQLADHVRNTYQNFKPSELQEMQHLQRIRGTNWMTPAKTQRLTVLENAYNGAHKLAEFKASLGDIKYDFFDKPFLADAQHKFVSSFVKHSNDVQLHKGLMAASMDAAQAGPGAVSVWQTMKDAGLTMRGKEPMDLSRQAMSKFFGGATLTPKQAVAAMRTRMIPKSAYDDIVKNVSTFTSPTWLKEALKVVDSATNMFRGLATQPWPAYLNRNLGSNIAHGYLHNGFDPTATGAMRYVKPLQDSWAFRNGGVIKDANKIPGLTHLTPAEATKEFGREVIQWGIAGKGTFEHTANLPMSSDALRDLIPGIRQPGFKEVAENFTGKAGGTRPGIGSYLNPFGLKGVQNPLTGKVNKLDTNPLVGYGRDVSTMTDAWTRTAHYIAKRRQGFTPEAARMEVLKSFYDFSNLSVTESAVMRRMMPFYGFARQSVPTILKEMFESPGGKMANVFKTLAKARGSKEGFLPEHLGDRAAVPIGEEKDGTQRYLSQLGLPMEDVGQIAAGPMQYALGQLNPFIKGPLEVATNRQFFSGRELSDLRSTTGMPPALENLLTNSPLARIPTTARTLADPRKGPLAKALNLLTGVKLTDVDMDRARTAAGRRALEEQLRSLPNVRQTPGRPYIPRSLRANATEEEKALMALYGSLRGR